MTDSDIPEVIDAIEEDRKQNKYLIPNIARGLKILEYLAREKKEASLAEIASDFNYPKNSVFRVMKTLEFYGYVEEEGRKYHTTPRLLYLGYAGMQNKGLVENSVDIMHAIRDELNETVMVGTILGNQIVILEQFISFQYIKFTTEIGARVQIQASAPGKSIMAFLPEEERNKLIDQITFVRYTDKTLPSKKEMMEEMEIVRKQGYAVDDGEEAVDVHCIGAPIFDYRNYPIAAVWIVGPDYRVTRERYQEIGESMKAYAMKISRRFGYDPG